MASLRFSAKVERLAAAAESLNDGDVPLFMAWFDDGTVSRGWTESGRVTFEAKWAEEVWFSIGSGLRPPGVVEAAGDGGGKFG